MLASPGGEINSGEDWIFEKKYDGIRVLAYAGSDAAVLITRNGNHKTRQFPEVARALGELTRGLGRDLVIDGEIVALADGEVARFGELQGRMHLSESSKIAREAETSPAALVAFDLLLEGEEVLVPEPWSRRRAALEALLEGRTCAQLRLAEYSASGEQMMRRARAAGWEGVIAKRVTAPYQPGSRSKDWLKLKIEGRQEFVVGGYTEPRGSRKHFGALLLGYYQAGKLIYAGSTGTGFAQGQLKEIHRRLRRLARKTPPFVTTPSTNEKACWVSPKMVVEVKFNEWTKDGKLRQPVFLGLRDDKDPRAVVREAEVGAHLESSSGTAPRAAGAGAKTRVVAATAAAEPVSSSVVKQLERIEREEGGSGTLEIDESGSLAITNLAKPYFLKPRRTKGDLIRYYARMSEYILPAMRDRPLVLRRFPNGTSGKAFYQQTPPDEVPEGVRVETLVDEGGEEQRRLVGDGLATLLYGVQLGAISYDPWHSRVGSLDYADYTILDLDPGPRTPFRRVVEVAGYLKKELDRLGMQGVLKTSGASGLHVYLPLPPRTPLEAATLVAQILATRVAQQYPRAATIVRMTKQRPSATVYVDYLQNILGKSVAGVYAVRARKGATVSTPLHWEELADDLDASAFTIDTVPGRVESIGDLWADGMSTPNRLDALLPGAS
jgi:bifunctional non-homologous end joining protein LigD